jgi:integrase/recombinase XerD
MRYVVDQHVVLSRAPDGPLALHIIAFAKNQKGQGYTRYSIHRQVLLAASFSHWLMQKGIALRHVKSDHLGQYLRHRAQRVRCHNFDIACLKRLLDFLRGEGLIASEKILARRLTPAERIVQAYAEYLREARGLAKTSIINYVPFIRGFLNKRFSKGPAVLSQLNAHDVVGFVQQQATHLHQKRAKLLTCALRSFLRYARYRGDLKLDLAAAVPVVPNWSMPSIPRGIGMDQVRHLLASINRRTAIGRRDYAILLLLARLALRSSEIVSLDLEDIDWKAGRLNVRGKGGRQYELPLPKDVGKAIVAYLQHGRPHSISRRVFLRSRPPIRGFFGQGGIGSLVRQSIIRAGVISPTKGAHQFRHGLATQMLRHGASLTEIGEVLGHRNPETTKIYTKVDLTALRTLALPWPGGAR